MWVKLEGEDSEVSGFALFCSALRTVLPTSQPDGRTANSSDAFYK
jgi:hypothetical protein